MYRIRHIVTGQVQGVGFRPFVYRLAKKLQLSGSVRNDSQGVIIEVQGDLTVLKQFTSDLSTELPPLAKIKSHFKQTINTILDEKTFEIIASHKAKKTNVLITPDVAICQDCLNELINQNNRRFHYPFINCTNCGPRYTITKKIPYDRVNTSMSCFPLCEKCNNEYTNPLDRRFHAQPNACQICGPKNWLTNDKGEEIFRDENPVLKTSQILKSGKIMAIKGLGGFHLVCDAYNESLVQILRMRKKRPSKALAIMVFSLEVAKTICKINEQEAKILISKERPIVLLKIRKETNLSYLAPDTNRIGIMLPYTPLHQIIFSNLEEKSKNNALVMTSGNLHQEPICLGNREALSRLSSIADYFLLHNRDILIRCDDSVVQVVNDKMMFIRRARGYVPLSIDTNQKSLPIFGAGALLKNTFSMSRENQIFTSQHIGDLDNIGTQEFYQEIFEHFQNLLQITPELIITDKHPNFFSTKFSKELNIKTIKLQHHVAHLMAVSGEHQNEKEFLGISLDGFGLGDDEKSLWGGELFLINPIKPSYKRIGRMSLLPLPGADMATKEIWRIACGIIENFNNKTFQAPWDKLFSDKTHFIKQMVNKNIQTPYTSSCGRLFDAVSALLGLNLTTDYEGQAAIKLEAIQDFKINDIYKTSIFTKNELFILDSKMILQQIILDIENNILATTISRKFHLSLVQALLDWILYATKFYKTKLVVLGGGCFSNRVLSTDLPKKLNLCGFDVLQPTQLPPSDGAISFGQIIWGQALLKNK